MTIDNFPVDWQRSGLVDESFGLSRPTAPSALYLPRIVGFKGDRLLYSDPGDGRTPPPSDLLASFFDLANAPASKVVAFARSYGPLGLCEHGLPFAHCGHQQVYLEGGYRRGDWKPRLYFESIQKWKRLSRSFRAALNVFSRVLRRMGGLEEDWKALHPSYLHKLRNLVSSSDASPEHADFDGSLLCQMWLNPLIAMTRLHPMLFCEKGRIETGLTAADGFLSSPYNLSGVLVLQLTLAVARAEGSVMCQACRKSFIPARRPNPNRRRFCPDCGSRAAQRFASRDYWMRQKGKRKSRSKAERAT